MENTKLDLNITPTPLQPEVETLNGLPYARLTDGTSIKALPELMVLPRTIQRESRLLSEQSFVDYYGRNETNSSAVYFDTESFKFECVFDDILSDGVAWGKNRAIYELAYSRVFSAWKPFLNTYRSQQDWIEFLDERADDFLKPSPVEMLAIVRSFKAIKTSDFQNITHADNGDVDLKYATKTVPDANVSVPTDIQIEIPVWQNEDPITIKGRFRYRLSGGNLLINIHLKGIEDIIEKSAQASVARVSETLGVCVMLGKPGSITSR